MQRRNTIQTLGPGKGRLIRHCCLTHALAQNTAKAVTWGGQSIDPSARWPNLWGHLAALVTSVVAMPRVVLTTLDTGMLLSAAVTKTAAERAIVERATFWSRILECSDLLPLFGWYTLIACRPSGPRGRFFRRTLAENIFCLLELSFLPSPPSAVLLGFRRGLHCGARTGPRALLGRGWRSREMTRLFELVEQRWSEHHSRVACGS